MILDVTKSDNVEDAIEEYFMTKTMKGANKVKFNEVEYDAETITEYIEIPNTLIL